MKINRRWPVDVMRLGLSKLKRVRTGKQCCTAMIPLTTLAAVLLVFVASCSFPTAETDCASESFTVSTTEDIFTGVCSDSCSLCDAVAAANFCTGNENPGGSRTP